MLLRAQRAPAVRLLHLFLLYHTTIHCSKQAKYRLGHTTESSQLTSKPQHMFTQRSPSSLQIHVGCDPVITLVQVSTEPVTKTIESCVLAATLAEGGITRAMKVTQTCTDTPWLAPLILCCQLLCHIVTQLSRGMGMSQLPCDMSYVQLPCDMSMTRAI